jgi:hypothetical protein
MTNLDALTYQHNHSAGGAQLYSRDFKYLYTVTQIP